MRIPWLAGLFGVAGAVNVIGSIESKTTLGTIDYGTRFHLKSVAESGPPKRTTLLENGFFVFPNVDTGEYLLTMESMSLSYDGCVRVRVHSDEKMEFHEVHLNHEYQPEDTRQLDTLHNLPVTRPVYVFERDQFSVFKMLKSPMILLSLVSVGLVFLLPMIQQSLDPEILQESLAQKSKEKAGVRPPDSK